MTELLTDQLRLMARRYPDEVGYRNLDAGASLTFARWDAESNRLARGLAAAGVSKGDRVSIYLPSEEVLRWVVAYAAIHKAGAVAVPTNTRLSGQETRTILGHCEASAAVTCGSLLPTLAAATTGLDSLELVVTDGEGTEAASDAEVVPWADLAATDGGEYQVELQPDDLADIMYTSGTTGAPKGVVVRHGNASLIPNSDPHWTGTAWLHGSPLFTFAGISFVYNPMKLGKSADFLPKFDAGRWLEIVAKERPEAVFIVPAMAHLIIAHSDFESADLSSLHLCSLGSAPVSAAVLRRLQERMPQATVSNGYGMTEAGPAFCAMPKDEAWRRAGSVGKPMPPMEVRIAGEAEGGDRPAGDVGEVLIRLSGRQREYYRDPDATARTWAEGWLHTGDLGRLDEEGYLYIVGRSKEVIIRGGNNIYATDVESALLEHPVVLEAAVVGVPHEVLGEDVAAFVVIKPGQSLDVDDLRVFLSERLADYKVPRRVTFLDELPRNATGKVLKHRLSTEAGRRH